MQDLGDPNLKLVVAQHYYAFNPTEPLTSDNVARQIHAIGQTFAVKLHIYLQLSGPFFRSHFKPAAGSQLGGTQTYIPNRLITP